MTVIQRVLTLGSGAFFVDFQYDDVNMKVGRVVITNLSDRTWTARLDHPSKGRVFEVFVLSQEVVERNVPGNRSVSLVPGATDDDAGPDWPMLTVF